MGDLRIHPDPEALARAVAERWIQLAEEAVRARGRFHVALAGGSTPRRLYALLAQPPYRDRVPWQQVHVFFGDERCVPPDHPDSNYRMAREALLDHVPIPPGQVHRIEGEAEDPAEAATRYARLLTAELPLSAQGVVQFDLILLGMGADGHTASLFPGTPILRERARLVEAVYVERLGSWRISITLPVIEHAHHVLFMVTGKEKAATVREVFTNRRTPPYPVQLIHPRGELEWHLDQAAASELPEELRR
ncbi:MAG: 6-phosphogluconolactonase [Gammaproteobacteria bacterium]|nr:MAG: 6-phosphogluconolactonase [Gammaproteobacteria bacterium]